MASGTVANVVGGDLKDALYEIMFATLYDGYYGCAFTPDQYKAVLRFAEECLCGKIELS
jgi:hypothetical protein